MGKTVGKIIGQILAVLLGVVGSFVFYFMKHVTYDITVEAGEEYSALDFYHGAWKAEFTDKYELPDTDHVGIYPLEVKVSPGFKFGASVTVVDTVAPVLTLQDLSLNHGESAEITDFVMEADDATSVTVKYVTEPDYKKAGKQDVVIEAMDEAGNTVSANCILSMSCVLDLVTAELSDELPDVKEFLVDKKMSARYVNPPKAEELEVGEYIVKIRVDGETIPTRLMLVDTTAPVVSANTVYGWQNEAVEPAAFVEVTDASDYTVTYIKEPDYKTLGQQEVKVLVTDTSGNETKETCTLIVQEDTAPPNIICNGISATVGTTISYRNSINVVDNHDGTITNFTVDTSAVDISTVGTYKVVCVATDSSGNTATKEITVTIKPVVTAYQPTLEDVYAQADLIIAQIITPNMDKRSQCVAIYNWTRSHISYRYGSDKTNWVKTAYEGFTKRNGDCFTYASTAMAMMNRLGITCQFVIKEPAPWGTQSQHYWLLVDYGMGYYHFDSCPRRTNYNFCLIGDTELYNYSNNPNTRLEVGSHNFTRELYPPINP